MKDFNTQRLIATFMEMVSIDSESGDEKAFSDYLTALGKKLNLSSWQDKYNNVYIEVPGTGKPLMFNTHMDTVRPGNGIKPKVQGDYIVSDETTVLGADSKAGIAAMIELVRNCQENNITHRPLLLSFTCSEEAGIPTAQHVISDIQECIVPDRGTPIGEIIIKAPHAQVFQITIKGTTAYATTQFDQGKHAVRTAARIVDRLPLGNIDAETTANVGILQGGLMTTMIPENCIIKGNCYSFNKESFDTFFKDLKKVTADADKAFGTKSTIEMLERFPGFALDERDSLVKEVEVAMKKAEIKPSYPVHKAVTNANLLNSIGIKTVLISTGVENQHTVREKIRIQTLEQIVMILKNCIIA